jgi:hypothetical protein
MTSIFEPRPKFRTLSREEVVSGMRAGGPVMGEVRRLIDSCTGVALMLLQQGQTPAEVLARLTPRWPIEDVVCEVLADIIPRFPVNDNDPGSRN